MPVSGMVVVKSCGTLEEAYLAKNLLESEGIESDVLDEATASAAPYLLAYSGIRLAVADEDAVRACEVLDLPRAEPSRPLKRGGMVVWFSIILGVAGVSVFLAGVSNHRPPPSRSTVIEEDRNGDGKPDTRSEVDTSGKIIRHYADNNFDGVWDIRETYQNGLPISREQDLDFDGLFDTKSEFKNGIILRETVTPRGEGNPLFRYEYSNGIRTARWSDPDRDGRWNERVEFDAMGLESPPQLMK